MKKIRIVADSTCDLSAELLEKYDIPVIPLSIIMDDKSYYDGKEVTPDEIFAWANANKTTPKTSAVNIAYAKEVLKPFMENGDDIIFFGISSKMSGTCSAINMIGMQEEQAGLPQRMFWIRLKQKQNMRELYGTYIQPKNTRICHTCLLSRAQIRNGHIVFPTIINDF